MKNTRLLIGALALAGCATSTGPSSPPPRAFAYDVIIEHGRVVDGTGAAWFHGDLGIRDGRIAIITPAGRLSGETAGRRVDATGLVVAPGFIDIQGQSDGTFLRGDGRVISKITQGITTEILGEGATAAPANVWTLSPTGQPSAEQMQRSERFIGRDGFRHWLDDMEANGPSPNIGSFVGATTIRMYAKGMAQGAATPTELDSMRAAVRNAMEGGAFGIASALIYPPGSFAATDELTEIAKAMRPYGGVYITHMRSEADTYLEAINEAISIGTGAGVPVEIYHLKAAGQRNWNKAQAAIDLINVARARGADVQANMYPYIAGGTGLTACFPPWAAADGKLMENLANPVTRAELRAEIENQTRDWENLCTLSTTDGVLILGLNKPENQRYVGKRLSEIALERGTDWVDAAADLIVSEGQRVGTIYFMMSEANVALQLQQPWMKFGTDAGGFDPANPRGRTHPRAYGTFPRILGKYVREEGVLSLEDAVRKASSAVATRLSIHDRGVLKEGMWADVVVFDAETITDNATFEDPHQLSTGMHYVFVNGVAVVDRGQPTGAKPGKALRGAGYAPR